MRHILWSKYHNSDTFPAQQCSVYYKWKLISPWNEQEDGQGQRWGSYNTCTYGCPLCGRQCGPDTAADNRPGNHTEDTLTSPDHSLWPLTLVNEKDQKIIKQFILKGDRNIEK